MIGVGDHEVGAQPRTSRGRNPGLRGELAHDFAAAYGRDPITPQLDGLERLARWIRSLPASESRVVRRSVPQLCRGLGLAYDGTVKDARRRHRSNLAARLGYLQAMGWVESWRPVWAPNGEGECWEIVLASRSRGCSSVGSSAIRRRRGDHDDRSFFSGDIVPPSRERSSSVDEVVDVRSVSSVNRQRRGERARSRESSPVPGASQRRRAHAMRASRLTAALVRASIVLADRGIEGVGVEALSSAELAAAPRTELARALFALVLPDVAPKLSRQRQSQLEAGAARIDRYSGPGAWISFACAVLEGWAEGEPGVWTTEPPRSLGALAIELKREANMRRLWGLGHAGERLRPLDAYRARSQRKCWRARRRRGEASWVPPGRGDA